MWAVMMAAMMVPAAVPLVPLLAKIYRARYGNYRSAILVVVFIATYLLAWIVVGAAMTLLQWPLHTWSFLTPMMEADNRLWSGLVLLAAGLYQFTPWKQACLKACRSPLGFLMTDWRDGAGGTALMAWRYGRQCVGCCWTQMLVMFAVGVMNLVWMVLITLTIVAEKTLPHPQGVRALTGMGLIAWGARLIAF
jgi:predicted metal-binding membrane protein